MFERFINWCNEPHFWLMLDNGPVLVLGAILGFIIGVELFQKIVGGDSVFF